MKRFPSIKIPCLIVLVVTLLTTAPAHAQIRGLFLVGRPLQYVDFTYRLSDSYSNSTKQSTSRTNQSLIPSYSINVPFAIIDPSLFNGNIGGGLNFSQYYNSGDNTKSTSPSKLGYSFSADGIIRQHSNLPIELFGSRSITMGQQDYSASYDVTTTAYGAFIRSKNRYVPSYLSYRHNTTETGADQNYLMTDQDQVTGNALATFGKYVTSALNVGYLGTTTTSGIFKTNTTLEQYTVNQTNSFLLYNLNEHLGTLTTTVYYLDLVGTYPSDTLQLTGSYSSSLGRGLLLFGTYTYGESNSGTLSTQINSWQAYLEHRLFDSLRTRVTVSENDYDYGARGTLSVSSYGGFMIYTKKLPRDTRVEVEVGDTYTDTNSKLTTGLLTKYDEAISVTTATYFYTLQNRNVVAITKVVNKDTNTVYSPNVDYDLQKNGAIGTIYINPSGNIHPGTVIAVTYEYTVDPSYSSNTIYTNVNYTLSGGRYLLQAQYSESSQSYRDERPSASNPGDSRYLRLAARANLPNSIFGLQYTYADYYNTRQENYEAYLTYNTVIGRNNVGLQLNENYNRYSVSGSPGSLSYGDGGTNTLGLTATLQRQMFQSATLMLNAAYLMIRGGSSPATDYLTFRLNYDHPLGKFRLHFDASSYLRFYNVTTNIITNVSLSLRRYF